jgi:hypothetical protein
MISLKGAESPRHTPASIIALVIIDGYNLKAVPSCPRLEERTEKAGHVGEEDKLD